MPVIEHYTKLQKVATVRHVRIIDVPGLRGVFRLMPPRPSRRSTRRRRQS